MTVRADRIPDVDAVDLLLEAFDASMEWNAAEVQLLLAVTRVAERIVHKFRKFSDKERIYMYLFEQRRRHAIAKYLRTRHRPEEDPQENGS